MDGWIESIAWYINRLIGSSGAGKGMRISAYIHKCGAPRGAANHEPPLSPAILQNRAVQRPLRGHRPADVLHHPAPGLLR